MTAPQRPGWTCPTIDKIKAAIKSAEKLCDVGSYHDEEDLRSHLKQIENELYREGDRLEEVRSANEALRANAEWWEARAGELEAEVDLLQGQVADLKDELREARETCSG